MASEVWHDLHVRAKFVTQINLNIRTLAQFSALLLVAHPRSGNPNPLHTKSYRSLSQVGKPQREQRFNMSVICV